MTDAPQDKASRTLQQNSEKLLSMLTCLDWQRLANSFPQFEDWSTSEITECLTYALRCTQDPNEVARERVVGELKTAWNGLTEAFKGLIQQ